MREIDFFPAAIIRLLALAAALMEGSSTYFVIHIDASMMIGVDSIETNRKDSPYDNR